jgi:putative ABC transport system permease protein
VTTRARARWLDALTQDVRYALRGLRRAPVFATTAILTLALGIGATTSIFSLINGLLLRALQVEEPHRLATISSATAIQRGQLAGFGWNYPMWERFRDRAHAFAGAFAWTPRRLNLGQGGETDIVEVLVTSSDFFSTLGVRPALGRTFAASDDQRGGGSDGPVTVVSHAFWQRHLAGASDVIGAPLAIAGVSFTVIGVTPACFVGVEVGRPFDVALTFGAEPLLGGAAFIDQQSAFGLIPMVRLKADQTLASATAAISVLQSEILGPGVAQREPFVLVSAPTGTSATGRGMSGLRQQYERPLLIVLLIVGSLLFIACANIANLLLVRTVSRRRELRVRLALGASRRRLAGLLLVESFVLGSTGALGGLVLAMWTTNALVGQISTVGAPVSLDVSFDWRVLAFTVAVTTLTVVLFGAAPAVRAAREAPLYAMQKHTGRASGGGTSQSVAMAQVALSLVLLVAAGLFVQTLSRLAAAPLGLDRDEVLLVTVDYTRASVAPGTHLPFYQRLVDAVTAMPSVEHAAASLACPSGVGRGEWMSARLPSPMRI